MYPGRWSPHTPDKPALIMTDSGASLSYRQLEERSLRLANHFRSLGLKPGDHVAVLAENRFELVETMWACLRSGTLITAVNAHLTPAEAAYIIQDCQASVLVISAQLRTAADTLELCAAVPHRIAVGGTLPGTQDYEQVLAAASGQRPDYEPRGGDMLYSSGTTGRPKGVLPELQPQSVEDEDVTAVRLFKALYAFDQNSVYLSPAPLYHAAPLRFVMVTHSLGGTAVIMPRFDPADALRCIEQYRVTHAQWVPTMFIRMLKLPEDVRRKHDLSSLKAIIHAAAPCPPEVKRAMIDWWGPIIHEYYAATEGNGLTAITSAEALERPGSVGKALLGIVHICGPDGQDLPPGEVGTIYFESRPDDRMFSYHGDEAKTASSRHPQHPRWATVGDLGWVDADGYLYLADRSSNLIISGGVNIYPQEIENELALHPDIKDVAVVGEPDDELGQIVVAYLETPSHVQDFDALSAQVTEWLGQRLAGFKLPRRLYRVRELPRTPTGKLLKRKLDPGMAL